MGSAIPMVLLFVAAMLGGTIAHLRHRKRRSRARHCAQEVRAATLAEAKRRLQAAVIRGEDDQQRLRTEAQQELETSRRELGDWEEDLNARDDLQGEREQDLRDTEAEIAETDESLRQLRARLQETKSRLAEVQESIPLAVEGRAGISRAELIEQTVTLQVSRAELRRRKRHRALAEEEREDAPRNAREIMAAASDRFDGVGHIERVQNTFPVPSPRTLLELTDPGGRSHRVFQEETGCELHHDTEDGTLSVSGDDPLARETARRVLAQLISREASAPNTIRQVCRQGRVEVDKEAQSAAGRALRLLGLARPKPEISGLIGRLKFRLSYSQNQLNHSIEVATLAGIMAEELRLDAGLARRAGLLHDIGKAMTHQHEGSHAIIGAEVAQSCGENPIIVNAIAAHHNDEPPETVISLVVATADALSGARPGARRESATHYIGLIDDIHRVASRSPAVKRVDIMHAGREVRVIVAGAELGDLAGGSDKTHLLADAELRPLALEIAAALVKEVSFAGQIKVTVIQESKAVCIAV